PRARAAHARAVAPGRRRRADRAPAAGGAPGRRGPHEPRDRERALPQRPHRGHAHARRAGRARLPVAARRGAPGRRAGPPRQRGLAILRAMKRIVVLGAGFGGMELCALLSEAVAGDAEITLIDQADSFSFGYAKLDVMFRGAPPDSV